MPQRSPSAQYDTPWKSALTHAFHAFMAFYFAKLCAQIDWTRRPRFLNKELEQIIASDKPAGMVADHLVEVCLRNGSRQLVLVHIEIQAQHDGGLARRVMDYNFRIYKQYHQPVASLVLLADDDPRWRPQSFHIELLETKMGISFPTAKLLDYATDTDALLTSRNPFALVTLAHLRTLQARHDPDQIYAAKWQLTKLLFQQGWSRKRIIVFFKVINWMMALPAPHQLRYRRAIRRHMKERKVEWIDPYDEMLMEKAQQRGRKEGREEGREEGRKEGQKEGAAELLERLLTQRFGPLPQTVRKRLAKASREQLGAWSNAVLVAPTLKQVFDSPAS